ncbi:hypothetical protein GAMM_190004 [Gammaproteobacteria bacterium]
MTSKLFDFGRIEYLKKSSRGMKMTINFWNMKDAEQINPSIKELPTATGVH